MQTYLIALSSLAFVFCSVNAETKFLIYRNGNLTYHSDDKVKQTVKKALHDILTADPYFHASVSLRPGPDTSSQQWFVTLLRQDCYQSEDFKLEVEGDHVISIERGVNDSDGVEKICGNCPDSSVEFLVSYLEDALFPGAIEHGWGTYSMALGQGVKTALLIGVNETKQAVLDYLSCPKLKAWGRIGHGSNGSISLNNYKDKITAEDLSAMGSLIKGRVYIFNSCLCHNEPFEPAMIKAGAYFYAGGDISLAGKKEGVFSSFFKKAISSKMELTKAMKDAVTENNYPNAWGFSGTGNAPYYLKFGQ